MSIEDKKRIIRIDSVLGGESKFSHFSTNDQFYTSIAIDPFLPWNDYASTYGYLKPSGFLRPTPLSSYDSLTLAGSPSWFVKSGNLNSKTLFLYDSAGSIYSWSNYIGGSPTGLGDLTDGGSASGNGAAYYDNYIYFARDTTVARYGPLDGTPSFTDDYWVASLGKTALTNPSYPFTNQSSEAIPNHVMHVHSGKLYFSDVVGGQGSINYIATKKTTVEGDTDDNSTYNALDLPFNYYPTAIESYGEEIVIAVFDNSNSNFFPRSGKLIFWDGISASPRAIVDFGDSLITALLNKDGILYIFSGILNTAGTAVTRYLGGETFQRLFQIEESSPPRASAVDKFYEDIFFGGYSYYFSSPCVFKLNLSDGREKLFNVMGCTQTTSSADVSAITLVNSGFSYVSPVMGWTDELTNSTSGINHSLIYVDQHYEKALQQWQSQIYKIGQPFKITKIRISLAQSVAANMVITPEIFFDNETSSKTLTVINNTNYANSEKNIVIRPENAVGNSNFFLKFSWSGSALCVIALPITIEYELIDD